MSNYFLECTNDEIIDLSLDDIAYVLLLLDTDKSVLERGGGSESKFVSFTLEYLLSRVGEMGVSITECMWGVDRKDAIFARSVLKKKGYATFMHKRMYVTVDSADVGVFTFIIVLGPKEPKHVINMPKDI